jgi:DNA ligase-1
VIGFARLIENLVFMPSRNGKLRLMQEYFAVTPDPDRGYALAALTGALSFRAAKPGLVRALVAERVDPVLFGWSYEFVGDLAETASLIWPGKSDESEAPTLGEVVQSLAAAGRTEVPRLLSQWFDACLPAERFAIIKLITGELRVGVSARLAKTALASWSGKDLSEIEEIWHCLGPPYEPLFAWLQDRGARPRTDESAAFRPLMLANALEDQDVEPLDPAAYRAEWKWDGIRVQLVAKGNQRRMYSRTGDEITGAFPEIVQAMNFEGVLDGELLVLRGGEVAPFNDLQQRLNRKTVTPKMLSQYPAHVRLYDMLFDGGEDIRPQPLDARRVRLERWFEQARPERMDLSPLIPFASWDELRTLRAGARENGIEGLMLKRADSPYLVGRPKGPWFKWKRGALTLDTVLMYAQRGSGKRSSYYSDFTFGAWRADDDGVLELVPVGKAYFGFTDEELLRLDRWVRNNTINRFGPVREVTPKLVLEVAFDSVHRSNRHRSGVAMRFPRVSRIRWDKPAGEADELATLERMIVG